MAIILRCIAVDMSQLPESFVDELGESMGETRFHLTLNKEYMAMGITNQRGEWWYYIEDDFGSSYPIWHPRAIFVEVDDLIPENWVSCDHVGYNGEKYTTVSFPEWARDPYFYERLVGGDEVTVAIYEAEREKLLVPYRPAPIEPEEDKFYRYGFELGVG
ncbi:hypothetical protein [Lysinibacter sp. HNR]|uniref:hypothetical protein n=1 Tax=Lysinibacter sp. HNR TaxID=3031408 RepID=UPI002434BFB8|nr:hypothetical protein [Lysinibacter sp. HNR]WGD37432.1 hypothetical protein FrondiHNR_00480 [Lysinibacter sp. HNR]